MSFSISYKLRSVGWADCFIYIEEDATVLTASYLDDALGNLAEATLKMAKGETISYAIFEEEPGEFRWKISKITEQEISVEILWFDDSTYMPQADDKGKTLLQFECKLIVFVRKIITCLSEVLNEYGLEGYKEKWDMHEFPLKTYNELRSILPKLK